MAIWTVIFPCGYHFQIRETPKNAVEYNNDSDPTFIYTFQMFEN